jgi:hypothetical protein
MSAREDKYTLGQRVTRYAAPKEQRGVLRFAIEFPLSEFAEIEAASDESGQSIGEFVRRAVKDYLHPKSSNKTLSESGFEHFQTRGANPAVRNGHEKTSQSVKPRVDVTFVTD